MRAARFYEPGQNLRIEEIPIPEPHGDEILVRVRAAGVCHTDVHIRNGRIPLMPSIELPLTLGHETAGEIAALARDAKVHCETSTFSLETRNDALDQVESGLVLGRAVVIP
jgi:propanol-preferring alcohol dehydrogenase